MLELGLDLTLLFLHGAFVQETISLFLERFDIVLVEELGPIQLLDQLFIDASLAWRSLSAQLDINKVKYACLQLFAVRLGVFCIALWLIIRIVEMPVDLLSDAQKFRLFDLV